MTLKWIALGIVLCLLSLTLLLVMDTSENPVYIEEDNSARTIVVEENSIDLFAKWQERQPNEINQRKWDSYMENDE